MSVFRVEKNRNYTVMSNHHLKDKKLSFKAKGLLSYMLSLPDDWDYSIEGLCTVGKDSKSAIKSALQELKYNNYLVVNRLMPNESKSGRIESEYIIFEIPHNKKQEPKINPCFSEIENHTQLNTNKLNTKKRKSKKKNNNEFEFLQNGNIDFENVYDN